MECSHEVGPRSFICWCPVLSTGPGTWEGQGVRKGREDGERERRNEGGFWKARDPQTPQGLRSIGFLKLPAIRDRVCPLSELISITTNRPVFPTVGPKGSGGKSSWLPWVLVYDS